MPSLKTCSRCQTPKPLDQFYRRRGVPDGHRGICIECWLAHYRPALSAYYAKHGQRINAEQRVKRAANPEPFRQRQARSYRRHRERRVAYSRAYRQRHRVLSLDYGWTFSAANDRIQYELWQAAQSAQERREQAHERLAAIVQHLSDEQRTFLATFEECEMDVEATAKRLGMTCEGAAAELLSIREGSRG